MNAKKNGIVLSTIAAALFLTQFQVDAQCVPCAMEVCPPVVLDCPITCCQQPTYFAYAQPIASLQCQAPAFNSYPVAGITYENPIWHSHVPHLVEYPANPGTTLPLVAPAAYYGDYLPGSEAQQIEETFTRLSPNQFCRTQCSHFPEHTREFDLCYRGCLDQIGRRATVIGSTIPSENPLVDETPQPEENR